MTAIDAISVPLTQPRRLRPKVIAAVLLVLLVASLGYAYHFGQCEARSKFCVVDVAGTRSEIGCEWNSWSCYVSTSGDTASTRVFLHLG